MGGEAMTPKERAERIAMKWGPVYRCELDDVVAAIRDAENDAYERAVKRITQDYSWCTAAGAGAALDCAKAILALRHPEPQKEQA